MDIITFNRLVKTLTQAGSRRTALQALLAGAALGLRGRQQVNAQPSCTANGERCEDGGECCSGRCHRRNDGKKVCRPADNQGICTVEQGSCTGEPVICGTPDGGGACVCGVTTRGRSFCSGGGATAPACDCTSNRECERRIGKGAKCVQNNGPRCITCGTGGTICLLPCSNLDSV